MIAQGASAVEAPHKATQELTKKELETVVWATEYEKASENLSWWDKLTGNDADARVAADEAVNKAQESIKANADKAAQEVADAMSKINEATAETESSGYSEMLLLRQMEKYQWISCLNM